MESGPIQSRYSIVHYKDMQQNQQDSFHYQISRICLKSTLIVLRYIKM